MTENIFKFTIGEFNCCIVSDGVLTPPDGHSMDLQCLCVQTGKHTVLLDVGFGTGDPETGKVIPNLLAAGIKASQIDTVIISHSHPDHIGGIVNSNGSLNFPEALHYISEKEWDYCMEYCKPDSKIANPNEIIRQSTISAINKNLMPLKKRIILLQEETEVIPGIKFIAAPGHTPGHIVFSISSGNEHLVCICDLIHDLEEFTRPDLFQQTDTNPLDASKSRLKIFSEVITPETTVFANHFAFPGLGTIKKAGNGWQWQPLKS